MDDRLRLAIFEHFEVFSALLSNAGTLHFHHYFAAIAQRRPMHLAEGRRRQWFRIEHFKRFRDAHAKLIRDDFFDFGVRERLDLILQARQSAKVSFGQQVGAAREQLPDLHESGSHLLQIVGQLFGSAIALDFRQLVVSHEVRVRHFFRNVRPQITKQECQNLLVPNQMMCFERNIHAA